MEMHRAPSFSSLYIELNHNKDIGSITDLFNILKEIPNVIETKIVKSSKSSAEIEILEGFESIIGESKAINEVIKLARKFAVSDSMISLRGESGTGKEVFAKAIHSESNRSGLFIPVNCAAMPENLLETELFGYEAGAFTGAEKKGKPGLFEVAKKGTIFLDEIADMPLGMQAKLLRVLQDKKVRRLGGVKELPLDVRIISATNKDIEAMVADKQFREDLYFRINVLQISIPPLNNRNEDINLLAEYFLSNLNTGRHEGMQILSKEAVKKLINHKWKGNVRELKNVIERASILTDSDIINEQDIVFSDTKDISTHKNQPLKTTIAELEKNIIKNSLEAHPSIRQTAKSLGISHVALLNKIKKYSL
ncbi:MAG: hypothetical protein C0603_01005 [Denitrovibrio sp.]|nr:MAG: hypothetical protein C0603_01005 [Denitrovibrio sp.]